MPKVSCAKLFIQNKPKMEKLWKKYSKQTIKNTGGLPPNAYSNYKTAFKKGFMKSCKAVQKLPFVSKTMKKRTK